MAGCLSHGQCLGRARSGGKGLSSCAGQLRYCRKAKDSFNQASSLFWKMLKIELLARHLFRPPSQDIFVRLGVDFGWDVAASNGYRKRFPFFGTRERLLLQGLLRAQHGVPKKGHGLRYPFFAPDCLINCTAFCVLFILLEAVIAWRCFNYWATGS